MTPSDTAAAATAAMLGGPEPWTREPTHRAASGPPVQMLVVTTAIAHTSAVRSARTARVLTVSIAPNGTPTDGCDARITGTVRSTLPEPPSASDENRRPVSYAAFAVGACD